MGVFYLPEISGSELSPGSLNLRSKFERPLGRPRRGESQRDESSREDLTAVLKRRIPMCGGFLFAGDLQSL
jgi:hypothetical protein